MFNPESYRDTDFGLARGESFEPEDADDVALIGVQDPHVMTVLGPIDPDDLGVCLAHAYILPDPLAATSLPPQRQLARQEQAVNDLESFAFAGGRSIVDAATADTGRDATTLYELAQRVPLHIIASTGRLTPTSSGGRNDPDAIGEQFIKELTLGMDGTSIRAGIIRLGAALTGVDGIDTMIVRAAAMAHIATGAPLVVQLGGGTIPARLLDLLQSKNVTADRVIFHVPVDKWSVEDVSTITRRGAWVLLDGEGQRGSADDAVVARFVVNLAEARFADRILIAQTTERRGPSRESADSERLTYLLERFALTLMDEGADARLVRSLLVNNPRQALSIVPPGN